MKPLFFSKTAPALKCFGLVQMPKMGLVYIFVSELPESGLQGARMTNIEKGAIALHYWV
jgi:hypothetical protein